MTSALDMSLDDVIKSHKQSGRGRGGGRGRGRGRERGKGGRGGSSRRGEGSNGSYGGGRLLAPARRGLKRSGLRPNSLSIAKSISRAAAWQNDMLDEIVAGASIRPAAIETGTKLHVSNLDFGVSNDDIKELFSEVGDLKRWGVHFDRSGRSKGTAEVVFSRKSDAVAAIKRYNNVQLDGKPMSIEIIGTNLITGVPSVWANASSTAARGRTVVMTPSFTRAAAAASLVRRQGLSARSRGRGLRGRRFGRGRGRGRGRGLPGPQQKSAEELDAELETYHTEEMQIS